jgi:hypothetical protein
MPNDDFESALPPELLEALQRALAEHVGDDVEVDLVVADAVDRYNHAPQRALDGLTPDQAATLIASDWISPASGVTINQQVSVEDVRHVPLFQHARGLLAFVRDEKPLRLTSSGAFDRATVARIMDRLGLEPDFPPHARRVRKVINENDCHELRTLRTVLQSAELIAYRKGVELTRTGHEALRDDQGGALYLDLFFGTLADPVLLPAVGDDVEALLPFLPLAVWRLARHARQWTDSQDLAWVCWPMAAEEAPRARQDAPGGDPVLWLTTVTLLLHPMTELGLLECRELTPDAPAIRSDYRVSPLFDRFFTFHI